MEALQEQLLAAQQGQLAAQQERAAQAINAQAAADHATAQAQAAQAVADLAAAQAAPARGPTGPVVFTLSPALATNALINYGTGEGMKLYGRATAPLDALFNGDSGSLRLFLSKVQLRASQSGWTAILKIRN
jgi:multidrug efflux pump subunit AcrA (membrane-fusion protein)